METLRKKLLKNLGYTPTDSEILTQYRQGMLNITDKEENYLLKYFNL